MIRQTRIMILLVFSLFLFHTAEQTLLLVEQANHHAIHYSSNNQGDIEHQLSSDVHSIAEDVVISSSVYYPQGMTAITLSRTLNHRLLIPILFKHWEPPK